MLIHPQFDPVALQLGPLAIHWYGLTYMAAFGFFMWLAGRQIRQPWHARHGWVRADIDDLLFYGVLGVVVGGRLGYCLFYKPEYYSEHLLEVLYVWKGGMSFHGGFLGVLVALALFARKKGWSYFTVTDLVAPCVPTGIVAVRLGNFINGELWGREASASLPWAMVFPQSGTDLLRHPSPLYQALGEGLLLFILMWLFARKPRPAGAVSAMFLLGYGVLRFGAEYFREPDNFLGLRALGWSQGQWLSVPMVVVGAALLVWVYRRRAD
ncbi:prolipoprotein diacylglyceryl transferase [Roseateles sp. BYS180W]|uniref:Phosphatidylglycerol--prolipoprotein diacylglyceryl transferase n=1 Tax=Roseateles rivi TaxID=3299028 RepID=A0ABW7FUS6_9BURK